MNFVVIGTSWITDQFISAALQTRQARFLGTVSRSREKAQALNSKFGGERTYLTIEEACLDSDVDIIYIASPNALHYPQTKKALLAGKHVVSEKPIVSNVKEIDDLIEITKTSKGMLFEAIVPIHLPGLEIIRQHLSMLGDIKIISTEFSHYSHQYSQYLQGEDPNILSTQFSGGALYDLGVYNVYFTVSLFNMPTDIRYIANIGHNGIDHSGILIMQYPDKFASGINGMDNHGENRTLIQGEKGYIKATGPVNILKAIEIVVDGEKFEFSVPSYPNAMRHEAEAFFSCIARNDRESMNEWLLLAKDVAIVMEAARKDAGIVFAADNPHD
jgi:scyllo-inositol 2-dehydrogenase (NADP+)